MMTSKCVKFSRKVNALKKKQTKNNLETKLFLKRKRAKKNVLAFTKMLLKIA